MQEINNLFPVALTGGLFFLCLSLESYYSWRYLRGLKRQFPSMWQLAGSRTIWSDGDLMSAWPSISFLKERGYLESDDTEAIEFCEKFRRPVMTSYFSAAASIVLFFASFLFV